MDSDMKVAYLWDEHATKKGRDYIPEGELSGTQRDLMLQDSRYVWMRGSGRTQQPYGEIQIRRSEQPVVVVPDPDHVCDDNDDCEFHEYQGPKPVTEQGDEPTMEDLKALTVARLQELADKEQVDLTGLKLKDDILGRMAAHFGLDPAS